MPNVLFEISTVGQTLVSRTSDMHIHTATREHLYNIDAKSVTVIVRYFICLQYYWSLCFTSVLYFCQGAAMAQWTFTERTWVHVLLWPMWVI